MREVKAKVVGTVVRDWYTDWERRFDRLPGARATKMRLASMRLPSLGKWERYEIVCKDMLGGDIRRLLQWLPPECVSPRSGPEHPYRFKVRAHRPDVRLSTIVAAASRSRLGNRYVAWEDLEPMLDMPAEYIEAAAKVNQLAKLVRC